MTFYLIGAVISLILIYLVIKREKEKYLARYTKGAIVTSMILLTLSSWLFIMAVIYKRIKRRFSKGD